ncbi:MAG: 30S ribosomal protein S9 [Myxococcales bacterium]|nr:30S ribosomal protein S9 [Myxococcales bacterium]
MHGRYYGTGKRKTAIARVFMSPGEGRITVNRRSLEDYFPRETSRMVLRQPFEVVDRVGAYDVEVNVRGGGLAAQAEAIRHGIARALLGASPELRPALKKAGLLTRDARKKERKKPGRPAARKRFQYSKR